MPAHAHTRIFPDRSVAGRELGAALATRRHAAPPLVLGLPRGGVPVAHEVALVLRAPLDVMIVRKVGMPGQPELAIGAIASGNILVRDPDMLRHLPSSADFDILAARERVELDRRERAFRGGRAPLQLGGRTVILVDDGLATGSTMLAAVRAARQGGAAAVIAAAPVSSHQAASLLAPECDAVEVLMLPPALYSIGQWYRDFTQTPDSEVTRLLALPAP
ncbi:MAG: phosphoribosyltransferase [Gammaproteobacteria bacterium]|nr:phosphoribosyltransferase [Gammaproteobacteria bacterium]